MKRRYFIIVLVSVSILILLGVGVRNYRQFNISKEPNNKQEYHGGSQQITYRFPGEFEKHQAMWMQWPSATYTTSSHPVTADMINIIKAFAPYVRVNLMTRSTDEAAQIKDLLKTSGYSGGNVYYYVINHMSIWTRDVGPIFVKDSRNRLNVVDFGFDNYSRNGDPDYINVESQVDKLTGEQLGLPVIKSSLISEGGAIESNGRGTMMVPEQVALTRNPQLTKQQIEDEYKRVLGVKKVIWLKKGLAEDDNITSGHINEFARFSDPNTILLAQVLPEDRYINQNTQETYLRMEENYDILQNSTDQDGKPFRIIRIPMPPTLYGKTEDTGETLIRSYLNYASTNGAVLLQTYWKPGRSDILKKTEDQVKSIFQNAFPGRNIIGIDNEDVNRWGGGIHCITQHMPAD